MFEADLLTGKRILITGGGTGLGRSMGHRMAELGATLVICGRRAEMLDEAAAEISGATGTTVEAIPCDIRDAEAIDAMMEKAWPIDVLVNNAAANFIAQTQKLSARALDTLFAINVNGPMYCTVAAGRRWIEHSRCGVVLSILSTGAVTGRAFTVPAVMGKAAILTMTKSLAVEWGPHGIRTVAIAPGPFPTPGAWSRLRPKAREAAGGQERAIPLGRVGEHGELANLACYLISDQAGYVNGECVTIDGG
ncbi:MAG: SDR family oxidoreductase, partial [Methyloligellaceae bacterium]